MIDDLKNGLLGSERGVKIPHVHPPWVRHRNLVRQSFPLHLTKGPQTFLIMKRSSQVSKGYTHTEGAFRPARTHICRERERERDPHDRDGLFSWWRIPNERTLNANGAPLEAFRGFSEDHFRSVGGADAGQRSL